MADLPGVTVMTDASGNAICPVTCSPPLNHRSSGAGFGASGGSRSHLQNSRKLQVVMVIDGKVQKYLRAREMACADVQKVADSLHINLTVRIFRNDFNDRSKTS
ncbi:hypothetical protein L596_022923 [Steinernema carpocapsae]|uniref:Uncharacterized protein n=1 Tax=Steinernema carpocapsae TaxID=34508 RepID=A0A4U5MC02_STECR|nr:hypothetical protein L596_022923 [Steinernema carpocapsae]